MRFTRLRFAPFLLLLFASCQPSPETEKQVQLELTDAAAAAEIISLGAESGVIYAYPYGTLATLSAAALYGAEMSREAAVGGAPRPVDDFLLPNEFWVSENPYECVGYGHNRDLNFLQATPGSAAAVTDLNEELVRQAIEAYRECNPKIDADSIMAIIQGERFREFYNQLDRAKYIGKTLGDVFHEKARTDTNGVANYLLSFVNDYCSKFNNSKDYLDKINFINGEIRSRLAANDLPNRKEQKLVFLTVLKHSVYYWK